MTSSRNALRSRLAAAAMVGCFALALQGCYEKTVGASGFGAKGVALEKPSGPDTRSSRTFEYKQSNTKVLPSPGSK